MDGLIENAKLPATLAFLFFLSGVLFAAGQAYYLGFYYFSTYSYSDFVKTSILLLPIVFFSAVVFQILNNLIFSPARALANAAQVAKNSGGIIKAPWLRIYITHDDTIIMFVVLMVAFASIPFSKTWIIYLTLPVAFLLLALSVLLSNLGFEKIENDEKIESNRQLRTAELFPLLIILIPFAGLIYIDAQDTDIPDAVAQIEHWNEERLVNVLSSNSNTFAFVYDGKIHVVPRDSVNSLQYLCEKNTRVFPGNVKLKKTSTTYCR